MKYFIQLLIFGFCLLQIESGIAQGISVSGVVVDEASGEPIPFAAVVNKTRGTGAQSDLQGRFNLPATAGADSIGFLVMGYHSTVKVASNNMVVQLKQDVMKLAEVVVSTNRELERRAESPVAISSLSARVIERTKPTTIDQVLNQTSGVNMVSLGNEQHTMSIRRPIDYGASYMYLEDGIPIRTSGVFNHNALLEINMANTRKIEVVRGPSSSIYGSEAIGGAVNFVSKRPSATLTAGASVQANNIGYKRTDFYVANTLKKKLGVRLAGYYANTKEGILPHSDFNKLALSLSVRYALGERTELLWNNTMIDYYSDMSGSLDSTSFYDKTYDSKQTFTHRIVKALRSKVALNHYWNDNAKTSVTAFVRNNSVQQNPSYRVKDDYIPWKGTGDKTLAHGEENENAFNSYGLIAQHRQSFNWWNARVIAGVSLDYSPNTYTANYIRIHRTEAGVYDSFTPTDSLLADYKTNLLNVAGYVEGKIEPLPHLNIIAAVRFDNFNYSFDNALPSNAFTAVLDGKNVFNKFTPKLGVTYDFMKNRGVYANYSQGFVPPQVTELYRGNKVPDLQPVYYDSYEVGGWFAFLNRKVKLDLSVYRMDGKNELISVLMDDGSTQKQNAGNTTHQGIEAALNVYVNDELEFRLGGTRAKHEFLDYVEGGVDFSGKDMPQAPEWIANAQVTYKPAYLKGFRCSLEWQHMDQYFMDQANSVSYKGYDVFNLRLGYKWKAWEVWTNVMNASDELYSTVARSSKWGQTYTLGNPRNFNVGLGYRFQ